ncbi:MAG: aminotransferase class I/II-fold pyridoxal phosphate-dependent enzyme [Candidatus Marinimicrobia bacterium]|nr:aminotransferase class I/II-fold pyridoxal phosphate-dependent enzyme [Candidatus Neomarinimicrobiota bacterium]MCF7840938.1 aminotransferase class I/II-fold pyridoxal phosphate-dependent enzyme [Candidatus Neomarinimicrobiota bacterium]
MRKFSARFNRLGTETAFAVGADAAAWEAKGHTVYPFHLGDINLPTPQHIVDGAMAAIKAGKTGYAPGPGIMPLRDALAEDVGKARGIEYTAENVSVQPGGKPVISKFLGVILSEGESVLYPNPGYPIYESQIEFLGGKALPYGYIPTVDGFAMNREEIEKQLTDKTVAIIYNNYQNPIGAESTDEEMQWVADLALKHDLWVLSDEAYFDIRYSGKGKSIASLPGMAERTVVLYTFSKKFAMTGWRLGGAIGPKELIAGISKFNTNYESCSNHFIQHAGVVALNGPDNPQQAIVRELERRRDALTAALQEIDGVRVTKPNTTFYLFPDITEIYHRKGYTRSADFRTDALEKTGVSFCSREHFGRPLPGEEKVFVRFAYSGIEVDQIEEGLARLKDFWEA